MRRRIAICSALFLLFPLSLLAQVNPVLVGGMKWRQIGPFRGGRVLAVAGVPGDPNTYYFGAVAGGIFKSTNGGLSWTPTFDHQDISSIGAIAVADSNPNVLYAGTGEACLRGNISYGDGVYKSTDAGKTWMNVGLKDTRHIGAVIIDPRNPDIVLVAALGHAWGPNSERGVFRTADGGKTWQRVLTKTRTLEPSMSSSIPRTPALFTRHSGKCAGSRGTSTAAVPVVGSIGLLMAA
jgi:photosystem II stability/assembly factor-like uncharacterized protein